MTGLWLISYLALWLLVLFLVILTLALMHQLALVSVALRQSSRDLDELSAIINSDRGGLEIGEAVPEFVGLDVRGQEVHFSGSNSGDQALLFIAPGNQLCQQAVKYLTESYDHNSHLIIVNNSDERASLVFASVFGVRQPIVAALNTSLFDDYKVSTVPSLYLLRDGKILKKEVIPDEQRLQEIVENHMQFP